MSTQNEARALSKKPIYRVIFVNNGKAYEIYARHVSQDSLYGFVDIEGLLFDERAGLVVDPSLEKLKAEFDGVSKTSVPMHAVIRIDEVEKAGIAKIREGKGEVVTPFPLNAGPVKKSD